MMSLTCLLESYMEYLNMFFKLEQCCLFYGSDIKLIVIGSCFNDTNERYA